MQTFSSSSGSQENIMTVIEDMINFFGILVFCASLGKQDTEGSQKYH